MSERGGQWKWGEYKWVKLMRRCCEYSNLLQMVYQTKPLLLEKINKLEESLSTSPKRETHIH